MRVRVHITTMDGELLETFTVLYDVRNRNLPDPEGVAVEHLARGVADYVQNRFETLED